MARNNLRRAKRAGKRAVLNATTIAVVFFGLFFAFERGAVAAGLPPLSPVALAAVSAFVAGVAAQRYLF